MSNAKTDTQAAANPNDMPYVRFGNASGLKVSKLILGCMSYGSSSWSAWVLDEAESIKHIKHAWDRGINTFDTANMYSNGASEIILGKALKEIGADRESVVVLTKVFFPVRELGAKRGAVIDPRKLINRKGLSRKHIFDSIQASLKRLQLDYVDVLQCHRFDYDTPIEETMQALHDVVQAGYARYIGMSSCFAYQLSQMQYYAKSHNLTQFVSMQNFHNASYREEEREMVPTVESFGMAMIPWSPLARGYLTRPWQKQDSVRAGSDLNYKSRGLDNPDDSMKAINEAVGQIAQKRGLSMAQVALAWSLSKPYITAPIIGSTRLEALDELIDAVNVKLTDEEIKQIDGPYTPRAIIGHE